MLGFRFIGAQPDLTLSGPAQRPFGFFIWVRVFGFFVPVKVCMIVDDLVVKKMFGLAYFWDLFEFGKPLFIKLMLWKSP